MITQIESAVAAFLAGIFAAAEPPITAEVRGATNKTPPPVDRSLVIVRSPGPEGQVLQLAPVEIVVSTPLVNTISVSDHGRLERAVCDAFLPANLAAMGTAVAAHVPGYQSGGYVPQGWKAGHEDTGWNPFFSILLGVAPSA